MISVVCWKWKGHTMGKRVEYSARHVNVLAAMVDRHLKMPHEIVCVTDDPTGIDGGVRIVPLWPELAGDGRCYRRLKAFSRDIGDLLGERFVSLDLDTTIVGPLDPLFDRPEPFVVWQDPFRVTPYCGSQWMLTAGALPHVWEEFNITEARGIKLKYGWYGSDQAWMALKIPGAASWTRDDGVLSFRKDILHQSGGDMLLGKMKLRFRAEGPPKLPPHARIVHWHGVYDPSMPYIQQLIPWVKEHWRENERPQGETRQSAPQLGDQSRIALRV